MNAVFEQIQTHPVMKSGGRGNDGGVDFADQFVIIGQYRGLANFLCGAARFGKRVHHADQFDRVDLLG